MSVQLEKKLDLIGSKVAEKVGTVEKRLSEVETTVKRIAERPASNSKVYAEARDTGEKRYGYKHFGEFLRDVRSAATNHQASSNLAQKIDKGITKGYSPDVNKAALGLNVAVDAEGGFLVPPEFSNEIIKRVYENDLLSRTSKMTISGRTIKIPGIDETSRVDGSRFGGVQAYWVDEAGTATATKPKLRHLTLTLKKLMAVGYVTEELLDDSAVAMDTFLTDSFAAEIDFKVGDSIINGTGVAMPKGILSSAAKVEVAKEAGQAAATVTATNIWKMWQRMWAPCRSNAVWLINQDVEHQLLGMTMPGATPAYPIYLPPGGVSEKPYSTLLGRPIIPIEFCATLGTAGDIILADLREYVTVSKGSVDTQMSMHVQFLTDEMAYRTIFRIDGDCKWHAPLTPYKGSNTLSPIVTLATRS